LCYLPRPFAPKKLDFAGVPPFLPFAGNTTLKGYILRIMLDKNGGQNAFFTIFKNNSSKTGFFDESVILLYIEGYKKNYVALIANDA
jgi:hypothetical protein